MHSQQPLQFPPFSYRPSFANRDGDFLLGGIALLATQLATARLAPAGALAHVVELSPASMLQNAAAKAVPNRPDPFSLLSGINAALVGVAWAFPSADSIVSMASAAALFITLLPLSEYTFRLLLRKPPALHFVPQLEACLARARAVDGVVGFEDRRFWTVSFGKLVRSERNFANVVRRHSAGCPLNFA